MIYEHRTYYILPGKMGEFVETFAETPVKVFEKYGAKLVGFWTTDVGQSNEVIYILAFNDMAHRDRVWQQVREDQDMIKYRQAGGRTEKIINRILRPSDFSPLK